MYGCSLKGFSGNNNMQQHAHKVALAHFKSCSQFSTSLSKSGPKCFVLCLNTVSIRDDYLHLSMKIVVQMESEYMLQSPYYKSINTNHI